MGVEAYQTKQASRPSFLKAQICRPRPGEELDRPITNVPPLTGIQMPLNSGADLQQMLPFRPSVAPPLQSGAVPSTRCRPFS